MSMLPNSLLPEQLPKAQFRAVVPCGYGVDLFPLVEPADQLSSDEEDARPAGIRSHGRGHGQCKALLPVAGKKMIDWVLERIEAAGIFGAHPLAPLPDSLPTRADLHCRTKQTSSSSRPTRLPSPSRTTSARVAPHSPVRARTCTLSRASSSRRSPKRWRQRMSSGLSCGPPRSSSSLCVALP